MRLANIEKAGYFPLSPSVTALVPTYIAAPHGGRIQDRCAGEGVTRATLAETLNMEPFGVELHERRAQEARALVQKLAIRQLTQYGVMEEHVMVKGSLPCGWVDHTLTSSRSTPRFTVKKAMNSTTNVTLISLPNLLTDR